MPRYSRRSKANLATCNHHLQILFNELIKHRDCTILCGHRGEESQNEMFALGRSKVQWPTGKHNTDPSDAVDAVPYLNGRVCFDTENCRMFAGYVLGFADAMNLGGRIGCRIRSGADWDKDGDVHDQTFHDICHFEVIERT